MQSSLGRTQNVHCEFFMGLFLIFDFLMFELKKEVPFHSPEGVTIIQPLTLS